MVEVDGNTLCELVLCGSDIPLITGISRGPGARFTIASNTSALEISSSDEGILATKRPGATVASSETMVECAEAKGTFLNWNLRATNETGINTHADNGAVRALKA